MLFFSSCDFASIIVQWPLTPKNHLLTTDGEGVIFFIGVAIDRWPMLQI